MPPRNPFIERSVHLLAVLVMLCCTAPGLPPAAEPAYERTIHVDRGNGSASDANAGTPDRPLLTVQEAMKRAIANKRNGVSSRVVVHPGIYREFVDVRSYTNFESNDPENRTPILVEAAVAGAAVISGSDVWSDWLVDGEHFVHEWTYNWGPAPNPWQGDREVAEITLRREMVFVDGTWYRQVLSRDALRDRTFFVDEARNRLYVDAGPTDVRTATVEVAVRERTWWQEYEHNVTIRGLVFQHAAEPWSNVGGSARFTGSDGLLIEDCVFRWNNYMGIYTGESANVTWRGLRAVQNGADGWGPWRVKNLLAENTETSYNNWRGKLGGYTGWSVGNKMESVHGLVVRNHRSIANLSRGLWLDYDMKDVLLENVEIRSNLLDALFIEAAQGPVVIRNSRFCLNGRNGIFSSYAENVVLEDNVVGRNLEAQIVLIGEGSRSIQDFETGERIDLQLRDWTLRRNRIFGGTAVVRTERLGSREWSTFASTLTSDQNTWFDGDDPRSFQIRGRSWTFDGWMTDTGQDRSSSFSAPAVDACAPAAFAPETSSR